MASKYDIAANVFPTTGGKQIATVILNGHNIQSGGPLGTSGAMRSFRMVNGSDDLWDKWDAQQPLVLVAKDGKKALARIAAFPTSIDGVGYMEFLSAS